MQGILYALIPFMETEDEVLKNAKEHEIKEHSYIEESYNEEISKNLEYFKKIKKL